MAKKRVRSIGMIIKKARCDLGLTADDVAASCNVSRSRVYGWERDYYIMPKNLPALSNTLQVPLRRLETANFQDGVKRWDHLSPARSRS